jgi:hypothetical protein
MIATAVTNLQGLVGVDIERKKEEGINIVYPKVSFLFLKRCKKKRGIDK